jgi:hypothetical protein
MDINTLTKVDVPIQTETECESEAGPFNTATNSAA